MAAVTAAVPPTWLGLERRALLKAAIPSGSSGTSSDTRAADTSLGLSTNTSWIQGPFMRWMVPLRFVFECSTRMPSRHQEENELADGGEEGDPAFEDDEDDEEEDEEEGDDDEEKDDEEDDKAEDGEWEGEEARCCLFATAAATAAAAAARGELLRPPPLLALAPW